MSNKKNNRSVAIVKLVVWSVVLAVLVTVFTLSMILSNADFNIFNFGGTFSVASGYFYSDSDKYNVGNISYQDPVRDLDIEWTAGNLDILVYDGDEVKIEESYYGSDVKNKIRTRIENGTLYVKYVESGFRLFSNIPTKDLVIYLPEKYMSDMDNVSVTTVSAELFVSGMLVCENFYYEGVSGKMTIDNINAKCADIDTVNGDISISGNIAELDIDAVSAKAELGFDLSPDSIDVDTVSGNINLTLPSSSVGFTAELDSVSGDISVNSTKYGERYLHGSGSAHFSFDTVSGNVNITLK